MSYNLLRNARAFLCQDVNASTGVIASSGTLTNAGATRTTELGILEGFSFSQSSEQQTIAINEAGATPTRGQRSFNTALSPVEFSFSTYLCAERVSTNNVDLADAVLWNALMSDTGIQLTLALTPTGITRASSTTPTATFALGTNTASLTSASIAVNDIVNIHGLPLNQPNPSYWSGPAKIVSAAPSEAAAATIVVEYLTAPPAAAGTSAGTTATAALFAKSAHFRVANTATGSYAEANTGVSNKNQLQKMGLIVSVDNAIYAIDNAVLTGATIDFGLDGIATVNWTGQGSALRYLSSATMSGTPAVFAGSGMPTGTAATAVSGTPLTNKLSTVELEGQIQGGGTSYTLALTGGSLSINNNVSFITPARLGTVNQPSNYFTGARSISGTINAYLRTGANRSAQLLTDALAAGIEPKFSLKLHVGGSSTATDRVSFIIPGAFLQVPTVETADVISTAINFTAQGYNPTLSSNSFDLTYTNDLTVRGYATT
jgi:hypothetical protein